MEQYIVFIPVSELTITVQYPFQLLILFDIIKL